MVVFSFWLRYLRTLSRFQTANRREPDRATTHDPCPCHPQLSGCVATMLSWVGWRAGEDTTSAKDSFVLNSTAITKEHKRKRGVRNPASLLCDFSLSPVSLNKTPAVMAMFPVMGYPPRVRVRRLRPSSTTPNIAVAVPVVIARLPHPPMVR